MSKNFNEWTDVELYNHVKNSGIAAKPKEVILKALEENGATGKDLSTVKNEDELKKSLGIANLHANKLFELIQPLIAASKSATKKPNLEELLKKNMDEAVKQQQSLSSSSSSSSSVVNDEYRLKNGFIINFTGKENKLEASRKYFLKTDTIQDVKDYYYDCINNKGGEKSNLDLKYSGKPVDNGKKLLDYGIDASVTFLATFRTRGGLAQYWDNNKRIARFHNEKRIKATLKPDCIMGYDEEDELRVEMPCGHVFAPLTLFQYVKMYSENIQLKNLVCPVPKCNKIWEFEIICAAAGLTDDEMNKYGSIIYNRNKKEDGSIKSCPTCHTLCERPQDLTMFRVRCTSCKGVDFCWSCSNKWNSGGMTICGNQNCSTKNINEILKSCKLITPAYLNNVQVPEIRACPRCLTIVTYLEACKHMRCWNCLKRFCFVCLALEADNGTWPCNSHTTACAVAGIQELK